MTTGTVYGLGIGPGDPELITLKALRLLKASSAIAYPVQKGESLARAIIAPHLRNDPVEIPIDAPMTGGDAAQPGYDRAALTIAGLLDQGHNVSVLCEGDPLFYGSFIYLLSRLAGRYPVTVVPGVTSITACAAALPAPLVGRDESLVVLPCPLSDQALRAGIAAGQSIALVKVGRHFTRVRRLLDEMGLTGRAHYVERASLPSERVLPLAEVDPETATYFSIILVFKEASEWR
ncbi:Precorrin-2 C(20)-methyltransferase [uncultured Gammaproteobacteria bacterium]